MDRKREDRTEKSALKMFERIGNWIDKWWDTIMSGAMLIILFYALLVLTAFVITFIGKCLGY